MISTLTLYDSVLSGLSSSPGWGGDIVLCSWAKHFAVTVPLSNQVYQWVPVINVGDSPAMD